MPWQACAGDLTVYSDANWAGDRVTRKSTSGGAARLGNHTLKTLSKTQSVIALSSAESELYGLIKATAEGLGLQFKLKDLGLQCRLTIKCDASAALGIIGRRGLGKVRHIDTSHLWIQELSARKRATYHKVDGSVNPADLMTKALGANVAHEHMEAMGEIPAAGRSQLAASADLELLNTADQNTNNNGVYGEDGEELRRNEKGQINLLRTHDENPGNLRGKTTKTTTEAPSYKASGQPPYNAHTPAVVNQVTATSRVKVLKASGRAQKSYASCPRPAAWELLARDDGRRRNFAIDKDYSKAKKLKMDDNSGFGNYFTRRYSDSIGGWYRRPQRTHSLCKILRIDAQGCEQGLLGAEVTLAHKLPAGNESLTVPLRWGHLQKVECSWGQLNCILQQSGEIHPDSVVTPRTQVLHSPNNQSSSPSNNTILQRPVIYACCAPRVGK